MHHVLVVDDAADPTDPLCRLLRRAGYDVSCAGGLTDALPLLASGRVSTVLLDLLLPDVDGLEILQRIRADPRTAAVPVVMFTAADDGRLRNRAVGAGVQEYLLKGSTSLAELRAAIERCTAGLLVASP